MVAWLQTHHIQQVVMESTGIYWKSVFAHPEAAGIPALVVNAFHVKNVPGRKTDVGDFGMAGATGPLRAAARELHSTQGRARTKARISRLNPPNSRVWLDTAPSSWPIKMVTTCFIRCTSIPATR